MCLSDHLDDASECNVSPDDAVRREVISAEVVAARAHGLAFVDTTDEVTSFFDSGSDLGAAMSRMVREAEIVTYDGPKVVDGFIPLSEKPGIGVDVNEEGLRAYAQPVLPFFE